VADAAAVDALLAQRPIHNVLLMHVMRAGVLGRVPGFFGCEVDGTLQAVLMVGMQGGASLEVRHPAAFEPLARCAAEQVSRPRHITGSEDVTHPFWVEYAPHVSKPLLWERREHVYVVERGGALEPSVSTRPLRRARESELSQIVDNSAQQHLEDLREDRHARDPVGFRARHLAEIQQGHWWVWAEQRRIAFQVHVGPRNAQVVQLGGVFTPKDLRAKGYATQALCALVQRLHRDLPMVSLYCDAGNRVACRLYERVGFSLRFYNRSYLIRADDATTHL